MRASLPFLLVVCYFARISRSSNIENHRNLHFLDSKNCGAISSDRIAYGSETSLFEFPWMARLQYSRRNDRVFRCGGSVINKRFILTAAHCVANLPNGYSLVSVRLGEYDVIESIDCQVINRDKVCAPPVQDIPIDRTIVHPEHDKPLRANDIALIKLLRDADFSKFAVRPVCLPVTNELISFKAKLFVITGWGTTETGYSSQKLLKANVPFFERDQCGSLLRVHITQGQICAGGKGLVDSCGGDSGNKISLTIDCFFLIFLYT